MQYPGVTDEVDGRIYPDPLPQDATLPAVTYRDIADVGSYRSDGPGALRRISVQLSHWSDTREEAHRVESKTRNVLSGYRGSFPGGMWIGSIFRRNSLTLHEPETQLWRAITDYQINMIGANKWQRQ